ncbi:unnamed protein product [Effrenium voratum]|nr:unnamed protein product [Effrenium voratum]
MGNVQQVFRDITEDGNVWDQESLVLPCHKDVLSEDALPLPSLFLAPGASLKTSASRSTLGSESFSESEDGFGNFDLTPQKVVLQSTGLFTSRWEEPHVKSSRCQSSFRRRHIRRCSMHLDGP